MQTDVASVTEHPQHTARSLDTGNPAAEIAATAPGHYRVIRRNSKVTNFDKEKIKVAMTKAFPRIK